MDVWTITGIAATLIGIAAGIVQVLEYLQKRRTEREDPGTESPSSPRLPTVEIPHNLPPRSEFIGREAEKARVHEALRSRSYLVSIDGIGGIGKTSLALEVAYECLQASGNPDSADGTAAFEGYIWTTARDRDLTLNGLLDAAARTLDYPGIVQQPIEEKRRSVRRLLQARPYLLIVDNYETIADEAVREFLLDLPEPSKALLTTREQKLRQVWAISIKGLERPEAFTLIRSEGKRLGIASLERAQDQVLGHLYQATGGAPLAIKWAVGQIVQRGQSLDMVLAALHEARGDIFDRIFARSWSLLDEKAQQVLLVMPIFATSASREGIEAASDVHHFALDEALGQLVAMSLVDATDELYLPRRRYSIHPLTRSFAEARLDQEPKRRQAAQRRLAEYLESVFREYDVNWNEEGYAHLERELENILVTLQWCHEQGISELAMGIFYHVSQFMTIRGYWNEAMYWGQQIAELAAKSGDELSVAKLRVWPIGWLYRHRGDLDSAERELKQALPVLERLGEEEEIAFAQRQLGRISEERGKLDEAELLFKEALAYFQPHRQRRGVCITTGNLAEIELERGNLESAQALVEGVLDSSRELGDPGRTAHLLSILGGVARRRGDLVRAQAYGQESLALVRRADRRDAIADNLFWLARLAIATGQPQAAEPMLLEAIEIYERLDVKARVQQIKALLAELKGPSKPDPW